MYNFVRGFFIWLRNISIFVWKWETFGDKSISFTLEFDT